jgi:hypothetical protein
MINSLRKRSTPPRKVPVPTGFTLKKKKNVFNEYCKILYVHTNVNIDVDQSLNHLATADLWKNRTCKLPQNWGEIWTDIWHNTAKLYIPILVPIPIPTIPIQAYTYVYIRIRIRIRICVRIRKRTHIHLLNTHFYSTYTKIHTYTYTLCTYTVPTYI